MNFKKLGIIIQREYLNKVKKKSFLLITFLAPVLFAAIAILPSIIMMGTKEEAKKVGVVDRSGIVLPYLEDNDVTHYIDLGAAADVDGLKADLKGAGVDVLSTEPPAADNPLLHAKNIYITPHIAWAAYETRVRLMEILKGNIAAFAAGEPINVVN